MDNDTKCHCLWAKTNVKGDDYDCDYNDDKQLSSSHVTTFIIPICHTFWWNLCQPCSIRYCQLVSCLCIYLELWAKCLINKSCWYGLLLPTWGSQSRENYYESKLFLKFEIGINLSLVICQDLTKQWWVHQCNHHDNDDDPIMMKMWHQQHDDDITMIIIILLIITSLLCYCVTFKNNNHMIIIMISL